MKSRDDWQELAGLPHRKVSVRAFKVTGVCCVEHMVERVLVMQAKKHAEEQAQQKGRPRGEHKVSLWRALWTGFGWPYISLGLLKLFSDALNFAGSVATPSSFPADLLLLSLLYGLLGRRDHGLTAHAKCYSCK